MMQAQLAQAGKLLDHLEVTNRAPRHVGRLVGHDAGMLEVTGFNRPIGAGARIIAAVQKLSDSREIARSSCRWIKTRRSKMARVSSRTAPPTWSRSARV